MEKNQGQKARDRAGQFANYGQSYPIATPGNMQAVADIIEQRDTLLSALEKLVCEPVRYNNKTIEIDCASHSAAMAIVKYARAAVALAKGE